MKKLEGTLVSVHVGDQGHSDDLSKSERGSAKLELDGFVDDRHRGFERVAQSYDVDPTGTVRRNERQWSGVSAEELATITERMDLAEPLTAATLGANICVKGVPGFSQLPKGSRLLFPSGAALLVEEDNPPCSDMGAQIGEKYRTKAGAPAEGKLFPKHAMRLRGVIGIVDIPGVIQAGDRIVVEVYDPPSAHRDN